MGWLNVITIVLMAMTTMPLVACQPVMQLNAKPGGLPAIDNMARTKTIQEVQKQSDQGKVVHLKGKVGNQVPLLGGTAYELQDSTGTIWVVRRGGAVPPQGSEVVVEGTVRYQTITINQSNQKTIYIEQNP